MTALVLLAALAVAGAPTPAASTPPAEGPWLLVVSGITGDEEHREAFATMSLELIDAAVERWGVAADRVRYLAEREEVAPGRVDGRSTRDGIEQAFEWLAIGSAAGDPVMVVLIGHGSAQGNGSRFNLPGPDMGPEEFEPLLAMLADRRLALINTTASSSDFLRLGAPGRTIVTATRSAREQQETRFPRHWVDAFTTGDADTDKDGRISVLEAFVYASVEVARFYEAEGQLRTEHALLDDDGDGEGSAEPGADQGDGALARWVAFGGPTPVSPEGAEDPELARLLGERERLQVELDDLRARRDSLAEDEYLDRLEALLLEIAETDRSIRARSGEGS